jgi:PPOX class probable F420-dependent enzyme
MKLPPLTDDELTMFLREGTWVATIATHNPDGTVRMTPLTYAVGTDNDIIFTTWENSTAVRNLQRDPRASVLIDKVDKPYAGVHYTGEAETGPEVLTPQEYAQLFGRYIGDLGQAAHSYKVLTGLGLGQRFFIRFRTNSTITWDFGKIPGA